MSFHYKQVGLIDNNGFSIIIHALENMKLNGN